VLACEETDPEFHARKSARAKTYEYRMERRATCSPFVARYVWHYPFPLDEAAMAEAAGVVEGEHDFTSFAAVDPESRIVKKYAKKTRRAALERSTIHSSIWERRGEEFVYTVAGPGFCTTWCESRGNVCTCRQGDHQPSGLCSGFWRRATRSAAGHGPGERAVLVNVEYDGRRVLLDLR